jgi:hypothetical protein
MQFTQCYTLHTFVADAHNPCCVISRMGIDYPDSFNSSAAVFDNSLLVLGYTSSWVQSNTAAVCCLHSNCSPAARQALTPIPERLWAVRNVAGSMVRFGDPSQAAEAVNMLLDACDLAASHYGAKHPSCAGLLLDTRDALQVMLLGLHNAIRTYASGDTLQISHY